MSRVCRAAVVVFPLLLSAPRAHGQTPTCHKRVLTAVGEDLLVNFTVNRLDAWGRGESWAYTSPASWYRNLRLGWQWDEDHFGTNMFSHPYHGNLYFNSGRANCLSYWESAPIAMLGSWTWEYLGETFRPSLNDFYMTSFGGIAIGEVFHRIGATIRNNEARGSGRLWREIAALLVDPMGGLNRLARGEWTRVGANPPEHDPGAFMFRFNGGGRLSSDSGSFADPQGSATFIAELSYGDPFERRPRAPFDVFNARLQLSPGGGGLNLLRITGRLYQHDLSRVTRRHRHLFLVSHRYDFVNNPAYKFGAQSVESSLLSRWVLGKGYHLRTKFAGDAILLGAIDAPYSGFGKRTYDFGPGLGFLLDFVLERHGVTYFEWYNRFEYLHSVSGAAADHYIGFSGIEGTLPIAGGMGLGVSLGDFARASRYTDNSPDDRDFPELRIFLTWTTARQSSAVPQP